MALLTLASALTFEVYNRNALRKFMSQTKPVTQLLQQWRAGDADALNQLMPMVYDQLRALAERYMRGERPDHTMRTTALVHEAYLHLIDASVDWEDRVHFFVVAARLMRRILVDHARTGNRAKRGGGLVRADFEKVALVPPEPADGMIELDAALTRFAAKDPRKAQLVELLYFGGLTYEE